MSTRKNGPGDPLWFKDAIIYEVHVKSFYDSTGNGIGDIRGITRKLDYLADLGVTAIWLLPFYPSPLRDDGYDIADYMSIHPNYGNLRDFKKFLREAHSRGLKVITELVLNHTSDQHKWFQRARMARPGTKARDFYVWSDTNSKYADARIIFKDFETSNWTWDPKAKAYFWHRFYHHQPDLNFENPSMIRELYKVIDHWLDMGVDGLRLDAVPYLYEREGTNCENLDETYAFLRQLREHMDSKYEDRMLLAEANQWPEDAAQYFGDGDCCHMNFHFPLMPRMFMALHMEDRYPIIDILEQTPRIPENCQWAVFLRNHDELTLEMVTDEERDYMYRMYARDPKARINLGIRRRLAPLLENDRRKIELMNVLLMSMPGSPVVYYGDELGMGDNYYLGDRDGVRTPMQWSADRNAGFSKSNPQRLYLPVIIDPEYHYEAVNVETQQVNSSSLLWWMKTFIAMRKRFKAFGHGSIEFLLPENPKILAYVRRHRDEILLMVVNLSRFPQFAQINLSNFTGMVPEEVFSRSRFPTITSAPYALSLNSHGYYIFSLSRDRGAMDGDQAPRTCRKQNLGRFLDSEAKEELQSVLPAYLSGRGFFGDRTGLLEDLRILEALPLGTPEAPAWLLVLKAGYREGPSDVISVLLSYVFGEQAAGVAEAHPRNVVCLLEGESSGVIVEGSGWGGAFPGFLPLVSRKQRIKGRMGEIRVSPGKSIRKIRDLALKDPDPDQSCPAEPFNTVLVYGQRALFKLFRRTQEGVNPEREICRFLTEKAAFPHTPGYMGAVSYELGEESYTLGVLKDYVHVECDAWSLCVEAMRRFLDRAQSEALEGRSRPEAPASPALAAFAGVPEALAALIGQSDLAWAELLGRRTAQMHLALANGGADPAFAPEPFNKLYRRSMYQDVQAKAKRILRRLERGLADLPSGSRELAEAVLREKDMIFGIYKEFRETPIRSLKIRVHGDYHLKHLLYTGRDLMIIDFEGKMDKTMSARRLKRSPFRDVGDMVRSLDYAASFSLMEAPLIRPEDRGLLEPWAGVWRDHMAGTFLRSYLDTAGDAEFVPESREHSRLLLDVVLLDKALMELSRVIRTKRGQLMIPLKALARLMNM